jgi:photosystem II stability/assembly factor-like uncharacterized protein
MKLVLSIILILIVNPDIYSQSSLYDAYQYRTVGPFRGGRVTAVAGTPHEPGTFYMGATGGGVWKTTDYGTKWDNISDGFFPTPSIGAISVAETDPNIVYVGTGSDGIRSNVIIGKGMFKSIDAGKTWKPNGLEKVGQIGAVEIHPTNHNIVYVAAQGSPFEATPDRGIYKTIDGGRSWEKVLFVSDSTGFADLELLPGNPEIIFAAAWKNERKPWTIVSGGKAEQGGIYKSIDGGKTWDKITKGLPDDLIGKIDFAISPANSSIIYALVEAPGNKGGMYKSVDQGESFNQVSSASGIRTRPFYYTNVEVDPKNPDILYVMATGYYKSEDGGKNWSRMSSPHGDNHDMWINPDNPNLFIQSNDGGANVTHNGGKSWSTQFNQPTVEVYQVEVDNQYPYWLYAGQQDNYTTISVPSMAPYGVQDPEIGFLINTGGCETGPAVPNPVNADIVYSNCKGRFVVFDKTTGLEKSFDVGARYMYGHNPNELKYRFQRVSPIHVSPHDPSIIYHTSQYVHKTTDEGKTWEIISPDLTAFEADKQVISGSPITRDITGEEFYSTIYAIRESPVQEGVIWVGANDGPVHITSDGGQNWKNVTPKKLAPGGRVDAVEPSPHKADKAYISVLRYQLGDWKPYVYRTTNMGKDWTLLSGANSGIPQDYPVRVVREDPGKEGLLYAGTEYGMFISHDDGQSWHSFQQNLPVTPITDIKVHRNDVVISTMGRGFWILDKVNALHDNYFAGLDTTFYLFRPDDSYKYMYPKMNGSYLPKPSVLIDYYIPEGNKDPLKMLIINNDGDTIQLYSSDENIANSSEIEEYDMATGALTFVVEDKLNTKAGMHRYKWDMSRRGPWVESKNRRYKNGPGVSPGSYKVVLKVGEKEMTQEFNLMPDPRVLEGGVSLDDMKKQEKVNLQIVDLMSEANMFLDDIKTKKKAIKVKEEQTNEEKELVIKYDEVITLLETEEGTYMKPMFISQLRYLYGVTNGPDQVVGGDALFRLAELKEELEKIKKVVD